MSQSTAQLVEKLRSGDRRALARVLSLIEDDTERSREITELLFPHTGKTFVIGVTGAPGAGKSTLVDQFVAFLARSGKKVGVIAVDPSSPYTGGALLGDRIRMVTASELGDVFIRSMAARGALGGIAPKTPEAIFAFDAAGFEYVLVETVGVGQGEVEIVRTCDAVLVVLVPGMGDGIQALKAGILEIADLFVINKADYDGVERLERELLTVLSLQKETQKRPEIVKTVASKPSGIEELALAVERYRSWAAGSGMALERRREFLRQTLLRQVAKDLLDDFLKRNEQSLEVMVEQLLKRTADPASLSRSAIGQTAKADTTVGKQTTKPRSARN